MKNKFSRRKFLKTSALAGAAGMTAPFWTRHAFAAPDSFITTPAGRKIAAGPFEPTWESLVKNYKYPDWYRDAKFGIWAHWTAQCVPEQGDWYARNMYIQGTPANNYHVMTYGHPSKFGFKDIDHIWRAEKWEPEKLMSLYKRAGAKYFFALATHHDNLDCFDSKYSEWNSVNVGPKKDIVGTWARVTRANGLRFGVSNHSSWANRWLQPAYGYDAEGPMAGVRYDAYTLTKADGKDQWWEGLDPQDLYEQRHTPSPNFDKPGSIHTRWDWTNGVSLPDQAYCDKFYNRTADLIKKYQPDLLYFDDDALPLWPVSDAGLKIAADFYNSNTTYNNGKLEAVILGKQLNDVERQGIVWDIERGTSDRIEPLPWQTDTCIGNWHYDRSVYEHNHYKNASSVIKMLCDIVSKNGNLLLNIPVRADGTIDEKEEVVLKGIADWMDMNKECIFGTRPWKMFGEGPNSEGPPLKVGNFNEGKGKPFTANDVRFTTKDGVLYMIELGVPKNDLQIKSLSGAAKLLDKPIGDITLLGSDEKVQWSQDADKLTIKAPAKSPNEIALVYKISL